MGLVSSGSVHSYLEHLYALLWFAKEAGLNHDNVRLHLFTDGRDASPREAITEITEIEKRLESIGVGKIASIMGRYYAMDRDNHWDRTEKAYNCLVLGEGDKAQTAAIAIEQAYQKNITDEFIVPTCITTADGKPLGLINDNDAIIFFNFRPDRARQLTRAFVDANFEHVLVRQYIYRDHHGMDKYEENKNQTFARKKKLTNITFISMTEYEKDMPVTAVAFPIEEVKVTLARVVSEQNMRQLHLAETEKYAHITYFFNGYREAPFPSEDRIEVPSPKVATYDLAPAMSTAEVARVAVQKITSAVYDFVLINFAAPDMVGHTGVIPAAIIACEAVDTALGKIVNAVLSVGGAVVITGDHGNVEEMLDVVTGKPDTEHSVNPVPFIVIANGLENVTNKTLQTGILADVAPTVLALMHIQKPLEMTGRDLLIPLRI